MKKSIKVFIASPSDLAEERRLFREAINQLNVGFGDGANVEFVALGWEDTLATTGKRSQSVINENIDSCDVFILAMHRRWGQEAPDAKPYSSYTEEEFYRVLERWRKNGVPEIFVFFKRVDADSEADPGPQLRKVMDFRQQLEETRKILHHYFDSPKSFLDEVDRHLRAYAKGELPKADQCPDMVVLPIFALQEVQEAKKIALQKTEEAMQANEVAEEFRLRLEANQLEIAEDAARLATEGKIEFAREKLTKLVTETTNIRILFLAYEFFERTGDLDTAQQVLEKWLSLSGAENRSAETADALRNFGNLCYTRGELDQAEDKYRKSLAIYEELGHIEGMAKVYGNQGIVYQIRGKHEDAEGKYRKSLAIYEDLDRKEGMAIDYTNLGNLYKAKEELGRAEEMYQKALAIDEALCNQEGIAIDYGNLGIVYQTRGEFDRAEEMYKKALVIDEMLDYKEGMANQYGNLGTLYEIREELDQAEKMYLKAKEIFEGLGRKESVATICSNLGTLYDFQGEYSRAEEMYQKSLAINEWLGCSEGIANAYGNLGNLYQNRGNLNRAEEMYEKSIVYYRAIESPKEKEVAEWLQQLRSGELPSEDKAEK